MADQQPTDPRDTALAAIRAALFDTSRSVSWHDVRLRILRALDVLDAEGARGEQS